MNESLEMKKTGNTRKTRRARWKTKKRLALTLNSPAPIVSSHKAIGAKRGPPICLRPTNSALTQAPSNSNKFLLEDFYQNQNLSYDEKSGKVSPKSSPLSTASTDATPEDSTYGAVRSSSPRGLCPKSEDMDSEYVSSTQDREHSIQLWSRDFSQLSKSIEEEHELEHVLSLSRSQLLAKIRCLKCRVERLEGDGTGERPTEDWTGPEGDTTRLTQLETKLSELTEQNRRLKEENLHLKSLSGSDSTHISTTHTHLTHAVLC